jgi:hypothetical protein
VLSLALKRLKRLYDTSSEAQTTSSNTNSLSKQASNLKTRLEASGVSTDSRNALQKALNLREGSGFLEGFGDVMERAFGLASIKAVLAGDPLESSGKKALDAYLGKTRYTGTDVLDAINPNFKNANGVTRFLGGLATDILLDPATYASLGASALAKNATTAGAKALGYADDAGRLLKGANLKNVNKALKGAKTMEKAAEIAPDMLKAQELFQASKLYRTADTLDTIVNPIKLVPAAAKKLGSGAMKVADEYAPNLAKSVRNLGDELSKTFRHGEVLEKNLGTKITKDLQLGQGLEQATEALVDEFGSEQANLIGQAFKEIKKDPDRIWQLTSKVDGSITAKSFKGMSDEDIIKELAVYANNQVYFNRPTVLNEKSINTMVGNKGKLILPVQDFKNADDLASFETSLKSLVDDPDAVRIRKYKQKGTKVQTGYLIDIGENNARTLMKNLDNTAKNVKIQESNLAKATKKFYEKKDMIDASSKELLKKYDELNELKYKISRTTDDKLLKELRVERANLAKDIGRMEGNLGRSKASLSVLEADMNDAIEAAKKAKLDDAQRTSLLSTRELVPYEAPIINLPQMREIEKLQEGFKTANLSYRSLAGMDIENLDKYDAYIPKILTKEGRDFLQSTNTNRDPFKKLLTLSTDKLPAQAAMTDIYGGFSPVEVNTMLGFDLFDNNMISSNYQMVKSLNRRTYNTNLTKALFTEPNGWVTNVTKLNNVQKSALKDAGFEAISSKEVIKKLKLEEILTADDVKQISQAIGNQKFMIHKDAVEMFERSAKLYKQLDSEFYTQLNKYMKYWKGGNLFSVGYHLRNTVGAETNMMLAGMPITDISKYSAQAGLDIDKFNRKILPKFREWCLNPNNANVVKSGDMNLLLKEYAKQFGMDDANLLVDMLDMKLKGVWGSNVGQHDAVRRALEEMPTSKLGQVADKIQDLNYKLGATTDDMHRIAAYRWASQPKNYGKVMKVGAGDALDFVNYAMFDYKNMSPAEQAYFTKIFPFYNFIKNNLVFQFKNMTKNANNYKTLAKAYNNIYSAQNINDDEIQQYVKDQLYIPIMQEGGKIKVLKVSAPVQDATNLLSLKNLLGATNPIIQYITDRAYGEDLYTGAELGSDRTKNTQELIDILPYGRTLRTLTSDPLSLLLPVSSTTTQKGADQNAYDELERLENLRKQYKKQTGQNLPTLEDLGLR